MNSSEQIDRLKAEAVAADIRIANDALVIAELTKLAVSRYDEIANLIQQRDALQARWQSVIESDFGEYISTHSERLSKTQFNSLDAIKQSLLAEVRDLRAALAERDVKLAALEASQK